MIYPPSYKLPDSGVELVQEGSDSSGVILVRLSRSHCETYSIDYPGFTKNGSYRIAVHAKDDDGLIAQPVMMEVDVKVIGDDMGGDPSQPARLFFPMVWIGR